MTPTTSNDLDTPNSVGSVLTPFSRSPSVSLMSKTIVLVISLRKTNGPRSSRGEVEAPEIEADEDGDERPPKRDRDVLQEELCFSLAVPMTPDQALGPDAVEQAERQRYEQGHEEYQAHRRCQRVADEERGGHHRRKYPPPPRKVARPLRMRRQV